MFFKVKKIENLSQEFFPEIFKRLPIQDVIVKKYNFIYVYINNIQ